MPHAIMDGLSGRPAIARLHTQAERDVFEDRHVPEERVVLEDEPDAPVAGGACRSRPRSRAARCPRPGRSSPAMTRSSVVFPEPDGPSSATSSPAGT